MRQHLRLYLQPEKLTETLPTFTFAHPINGCIKGKAEQLKACLANRLKDYDVEIEESVAQIGSGSQPMATIPSLAVTMPKNRGKIDRTFNSVQTIRTTNNRSC